MSVHPPKEFEMNKYSTWAMCILIDGDHKTENTENPEKDENI